MADNIRITVGIWGDEPKILVFWGAPTDHRWWWVSILEARVVARIPFSAGDDALNYAMSRDGGGERAQDGCNLDFRHGSGVKVVRDGQSELAR